MAQHSLRNKAKHKIKLKKKHKLKHRLIHKQLHKKIDKELVHKKAEDNYQHGHHQMHNENKTKQGKTSSKDHDVKMKTVHRDHNSTRITKGGMLI